METTRKELLTSKCLVVLAFITVVYLGKRYAVPSVEVECIKDPIHDALTYFNDAVNNNLSLARFLQISSSLLMDIVFVTLYGYWVFNISTGRVIYATGLFYLVRAITQTFIVLRFPDGYYWDDPHVPSIVVPYGRTSDFFYSGHCGFLNLCALEWLRSGKSNYFKIVQLVNAYMAIVMLIFRIHYMIDITTAIFISHYIYILVEQNLDLLDNLSLRYYQALKLKIFECQRGKKTEEIQESLITSKELLPIKKQSK
ncbi:PAP2 family protein (macronuclear) [Tetrahymena thermophila SB210]|uniref:PAP2 family protein n=1 Tax=Tetrahymena thermophila (strain SB210) TaxID=312017 RepID=Q22A72_TETTS|nr:PAP2 family protein [Tetrahymena thermophila SB210]EAR82185.1 PAP2 family protein [Tetrahymena thermophila SB210]|eukprot:XP_001029848.1 PAP2 family protein [Tetrahymena thermophila SB210]